MFRIAICDDETAVCGEMERFILRYAKKTGKEMDVQVFYSGEELFRVMKEEDPTCSIDLVFLDIELNRLDGIDVGKKIREELKNEWIQIVYISGRDRYAMQLFQNRPLQFLLKPLEKRDIITVIEKAMELSETQSKYFEFRIGRDYYKVLLSEIVYFEGNGKKIYLHTKRDTYEFYESMTLLEERFEKNGYLKIHKSFLVNDQYIKEYHPQSVTLLSGKDLPISQPQRKRIHEILRERMF